MLSTRRAFLQAASMATAALAIPSVLAKKLTATAKQVKVELTHCDQNKVKEWLDQLSIPRKVLLYDNVSRPPYDTWKPKYAVDNLMARNGRRKRPILACALDGGHIRYAGPPELQVPINTIAAPMQNDEYKLACRLANHESLKFIRLCEHGQVLRHGWLRDRRGKGGGLYPRILKTVEPKERLGAVINTLFTKIEQHDAVVWSMIVCPEVFQQIKNLGANFFDYPHKNVPKWSPHKGYMWTAKLYVTHMMAPNTVIVMSKFDECGAFTLRQDVYESTKDQPDALVYLNEPRASWACVDAGYSLVNPHLVVYAQLPHHVVYPQDGCVNRIGQRARFEIESKRIA